MTHQIRIKKEKPIDKPKIKESDIRKQVRDYLRLKGWLVIYLLQGLGCYPGLSDLVAIKGGKVVWIELKKPGKSVQSEKQIIFQEQIESHGGIYRVVRGIEDLEGI